MNPSQTWARSFLILAVQMLLACAADSQAKSVKIDELISMFTSLENTSLGISLTKRNDSLYYVGIWDDTKSETFSIDNTRDESTNVIADSSLQFYQLICNLNYTLFKSQPELADCRIRLLNNFLILGVSDIYWEFDKTSCIRGTVNLITGQKFFWISTRSDSPICSQYSNSPLFPLVEVR